MSLRSRQSIRCPYAEKASASLYGEDNAVVALLHAS